MRVSFFVITSKSSFFFLSGFTKSFSSWEKPWRKYRKNLGREKQHDKKNCACFFPNERKKKGKRYLVI